MILVGGVVMVLIDIEIYLEYFLMVLVVYIKNGEESLVEVNFYIIVSLGGKSVRINFISERIVI